MEFKFVGFDLKLLSVFFLSSFLPRTSLTQCNNWLKLPNQPSYVSVGNLNVTGNKITVEATFNRTAPWNGIDLYQGDIVSKHERPSDCNYLLRPSSAEITTTTRYYRTPEICPIELNKTYHVAMVYDGSRLKFYRNGFLMSEIAATGNLIQNNWLTQIGLFYGQNSPENFIGYINEVRIWNIARTNSEIRTYMKQSLPSPQTIPGLLAYYTFNTLINKQGNSAWNGTLGGGASFSQTNPSCTLIADSCHSCSSSMSPDFNYEQTVCSPKTIQFSTSLPNVLNYDWEFGDGQGSSTPNPLVNYPDYKSYNVKLTVQDKEGCVGEITKTIPVLVQGDNIVLTPDTTICQGDSLRLRTRQAGFDFCWQPFEGVDSPYSATPVVKPSSTTNYLFTSKTTGTNLVVNADFEQGNVSFNSDYSYSNSGLPPAVYFVGANPPGWHPQMPPCSDHTSGNGNMMMVNGAEQRNTNVWSQIIAVTPNTNYAFSTWLETITTINPAQLQFSINGIILGNIFTANSASCVWDQFYSTWNSGNSTTATISIVNMNQVFSGNDFAIDDIFFGEMILKIDSVKIVVASTPTIISGNDTSVCRGFSLQLNTNTEVSNTVSWFPSTFLDNPGITNPISTPFENITYVGTVKNGQGCLTKDTVNIRVLEKPIIELPNDTSFCHGTSFKISSVSSNTANYLWSPTLYLSDSTSSSPIAAPDTTTLYKITAFNEGCSATDSILLSIIESPIITITSDTLVCGEVKVQLNAGGATSYEWTPSTSLSATNIANPIASVATSTMYTVLASNDARCVKSDSVLITVLSNPSVVLPGDTAVCQGTSFLIASTSTAATSYSWQPVNGLSNPASPTPSVNPNTTTLYKIVAFNGVCLATDSILISVKPSPIVTVSNDTTVCATASIQLIANGATKYQWLSEPSLSSTDIPNPFATPTITTTYKVSGIGSNGCRKSDSVRVVVAPKPVFGVEPAIQTICIEDSATLKATGGDAYTWTPVAQIASPVNDIIKVSPSVATTYKVIIENSLCNLTDSATAVINVKARPALSVNKSNDIDCSNTTSRLTVTGGSVFRWSPSESLSSSSVYNPVASPSKTTTYRVVSRSLNGCFTEDSITVKVSNSTANSFYIASAFTPNGDGKNDCFGVKNLGNAKSLSLSIFNRWGEKVFFTDNPMVCWNGSFKGVNQDTGVFVYYLEAKTFCGDVNKKGTITLIR